MKPHKWAKEIIAWANGAEIEYRKIGTEKWLDEKEDFPYWDSVIFEYRIKPQPKEDLEKEHYRKMAEKALAIPEISKALDRLIDAFSEKEPQYLYVYCDKGGAIKVDINKSVFMGGIPYIGKIKLEQDE